MKISVVIPVFNEETQLVGSVGRLDAFLDSNFQGDYQVVIADNGSTDRTWELAQGLEQDSEAVRAVRLEEKGRGRALKTVWLGSHAEILSYMDVDLSTDLAAFPRLIEPLASGEFDLAVGSRLLKGSQTTRGWKREIISRCYNRLIKAVFQSRFSDAQCGFKAITRLAAQALLPQVEDNNWFFDTELLLLAERLGFRVFDLPVQWTDDSDSRVKIVRTAWQDLTGLLRVRRKFLAGGGVKPVKRLSSVSSLKSVKTVQGHAKPFK